MTKTKRVKCNRRELILRATTGLYGNMLMMARTRELDMKEVLKYPLGPLPWSIATPDGFLRKTAKSKLEKDLQKNVTPAEVVDSPSVCVIDGMAIVYKIKGDQKTFGDIASHILSKALHEASDSHRIDIVFDVYKEHSIKTVERQLRRATPGSSVQYKNIKAKQQVVQWSKFLSDTDNKTNLIQFLTKEWKQDHHVKRLLGTVLYVTCEEACYKISSQCCEYVPELKSFQEEAGTRILLHVMHAVRSGFETILVVADDTDVLLLLSAFKKDITASLYLKSVTATRTIYIDIQKMYRCPWTICLRCNYWHAFLHRL